MDKWNDSKFEKAYRKDKRKALKTVFNNNKLLIKEGTIEVPKTIKITMEQFKKDIYRFNFGKYEDSKLIFMNQTPDKAASYLADMKYNVCVLNCCDSISAGGLYTVGYETYEEELCRTIPALYDSLKDSKSYPINCYESILYSPDLLLFRDSKDNYNRYKDPKKVGVVSVAVQSTIDKQKTYNIMKMMFYAPKIYDSSRDVIVLGPWKTCDPVTIAKLYKRLTEGHKDIYRLVCIALPTDELYDTFLKVFDRIKQ